jgi:hypothetical protein
MVQPLRASIPAMDNQLDELSVASVLQEPDSDAAVRISIADCTNQGSRRIPRELAGDASPNGCKPILAA